MGDLGIIDQFTQVFIRYVDSGFGLLSGEVTSLTSVLVAIDVTLAGLFWVFDGEADVLLSFIKKVLYVGAFAFILSNFRTLAGAIFDSFTAIGLQATGAGLTPQNLLLPGRLAGVGYQAGWPLLQQAGALVNFSLLANLPTILVLLFAWFVVIIAFFLLAVQIFITVIEFKLTTLAGFVLVPFALWSKTAFLAERVLGNVVSAGIKVMVLAIIIGIGSTFFANFTGALRGQTVNLSQAMTLVLASITLMGLGIFGPGIAAGLISGAPQLGAGAVVGTGMALAGGTFAAAAAARLATSGGLAAIRAGTAISAGANTAYNFGRAVSGAAGMEGVQAGLAGIGRASAGVLRENAQAMGQSLARPFSEGAAAGRQAAWRALGTSPSAPSAVPSASSSSAFSAAPGWARRIQAQQRTQAVAQAIKEGDHRGSGLAPDLDQE